MIYLLRVIGDYFSVPGHEKKRKTSPVSWDLQYFLFIHLETTMQLLVDFPLFVLSVGRLINVSRISLRREVNTNPYVTTGHSFQTLSNIARETIRQNVLTVFFRNPPSSSLSESFASMLAGGSMTVKMEILHLLPPHSCWITAGQSQKH